MPSTAAAQPLRGQMVIVLIVEEGRHESIPLTQHVRRRRSTHAPEEELLE